MRKRYNVYYIYYILRFSIKYYIFIIINLNIFTITINLNPFPTNYQHKITAVYICRACLL